MPMERAVSVTMRMATVRSVVLRSGSLRSAIVLGQLLLHGARFTTPPW